MTDLSTSFMGIPLKNPVIVGASNLCSDLRNLRKMEEAGAAAIVYKTLFEEQIELENYEFSQIIEPYNERHAEMLRIFPGLEHSGAEEHVIELEKAVKALHIPVFASLNAINPETWPQWAQRLAHTGIAGLELNFYHVPIKFEDTSKEIIDTQLRAIEEVKKAVNIPVAVKISPYYTNPLGNMRRMAESGANGMVFFNRFFHTDIDIKDEKHITPYNLSPENDYRLTLRFAGLLYGNLNASLCASRGIYQADEVIKMLLAGADCVQVVSTLYKNGINHISNLVDGLNDWMNSKGYRSINDFKGKLSLKNTKDPFVYKRAQYIDYLMKSPSDFQNLALR
ncbi:MAG: dihydroorotate dehydrogenase-like protein [Bacteroidales bacterium]|jgi:dihydroorotate dehydrogenase (fumarate)|nr:dihydroorotate dehydrogenase-like protein [Bacteroidales bacterium]NPV36592.1 dihydroorotate dehydrogenase-like protein [Bacteroidales bacterium]